MRITDLESMHNFYNIYNELDELRQFVDIDIKKLNIPDCLKEKIKNLGISMISSMEEYEKTLVGILQDVKHKDKKIMTAQELYNWAVEHKAENLPLTFSDECMGGEFYAEKAALKTYNDGDTIVLVETN